MQGIDAVNLNPIWGASVSFYDFDQDGWDDLSFTLNNDSIKFYRNNNGSFEPQASFGGNTGDAKHICWFDMENDGDCDVIVTYYLNQSRLFRNDGNWNFTDITDSAGIPVDPIAKTFGVSCGDYDKDGFLDLYICNYNWMAGPGNWLLRNNGDGTFEELASDLGVDNSIFPSFQSTWMDYNNDTWPDIYVINDKEPENALFRNNGDGTFTDVSEESGSNIVADAMSNAICDYNNDGNLDIYITNGNSGNYLLSNNGDGTFSDLTEEAGLVVNALSWGTLWLDHDNDLDDDAFVLTTYIPIEYRNYFYQNEGDGTFTDVTTEVGLYNDTPLSFSNAKGDFNNDGFFDMGVANSGPQTCFLYQNDGGENNYLKLDLEGTISNRDAVGTWLRYYMMGQEFVEYTMCGENYMGQDSHAEILSMGSNTVMDSLSITWPSGLNEVYYNITSNQRITIVEGTNLSTSISIDGTTSICSGDSIILDAGEYTSFLWSDGDTSRYHPVFDSGSFSVEVMNEFGFTILSDTVYTTLIEPADFILSANHVSCNGENNASISIELIGESILESIVWNTGDTIPSIDSLFAGSYSFSFIDGNGCIVQSDVSIEEPDSLYINLDLTNASDIANGSCYVNINGGIPPYEINWSTGSQEDYIDELLSGDYSIVVSDSLSCSTYLEFYIDFIESVGELTNQQVVLLYPNPVQEFLKLDYSFSPQNWEMEIINSLGQFSISRRSLEKQVSISHLSEGQYVLRLLHMGKPYRTISFLKE